MYKGKRFLAMIPARGGSKGIKDKNIVDLCGRPLISYSITAGLESKYIDKVIVSTDSEKIAEVAKIWHAEVPFLRPKELAGDTSKSIDAVIHCISKLKKMGEDYDYLILLQPTQPLRQAIQIDEAIEKIVDDGKESLVSISPVADHPVLMRWVDEEGKMNKLLNENSTQRRQDFKAYYKVNGSIYINLVKSITPDISLNDNQGYYIMNSKYDVDIDEEFDLEVAKLKLKNLNIT